MKTLLLILLAILPVTMIITLMSSIGYIMSKEIMVFFFLSGLMLFLFQTILLLRDVYQYIIQPSFEKENNYKIKELK